MTDQERDEEPGEDNDGEPECFSTGSYACGSEICDWCPFEQECASAQKAM
jgi:hypothetical protein